MRPTIQDQESGYHYSILVYSMIYVTYSCQCKLSAVSSESRASCAAGHDQSKGILPEPTDYTHPPHSPASVPSSAHPTTPAATDRAPTLPQPLSPARAPRTSVSYGRSAATANMGSSTQRLYVVGPLRDVAVNRIPLYGISVDRHLTF